MLFAQFKRGKFHAIKENKHGMDPYCSAKVLFIELLDSFLTLSHYIQVGSQPNVFVRPSVCRSLSHTHTLILSLCASVCGHVHENYMSILRSKQICKSKVTILMGL